MSGFWFQGARLSVIIGMLVSTSLNARDAHAAIGPVIGAEPITPFSATVPGGSVTVPIPSGFLVHEIKGNDRRINSERAWYAPTPNLIGLLKGKVCNWRIDFVYRDARHEYQRERGTVVHECTGLLKSAAAAARPKTLPRYGTACAVLSSNGKRVAEQCHNIVR